MKGTTSLVDLYKFALNLLDDPKRALDTLLLTEKPCWESFQYKNDLLEIVESVGKDRIGEKMAVVIKNSQINNTVDSSVKNLRQNFLKVRYFPNEEAALSWLEG
jgi:hypothetical protein